MRLIFYLLAITSCLGHALQARALAISDPDTTKSVEEPQYFLDEVIVTAARVERTWLETPYALDVIDKTVIKRGEIGLSLEEVLRQTPGVIVDNRHNLSQGDRISVRGLGSRASFGVRGVKVILDGIPLTLADGQTQLNNLDLSSVGSIQVLRGPSSSLYGNVSGGVFLIESEVPSSRPWRFEPRLTLGRYGLRKWQGSVSGTVGGHSYQVQASDLSFDGFRAHAYAKSISLTALTRHTVSSALSVNTILHYNNSPYLFNPSSLSKEDAEAMPQSARFFVRSQGASKQVRQGQGGVSMNLSRPNGDEWRATLYGLSRTLLNPIPGRIIELDRTGGGFRSTYTKQLSENSKLMRLTFGADLEWQRDERKEFQNLGLPDGSIDVVDDEEVFSAINYGPQLIGQNETVWGWGPFMQLEVAASEKIGVTLGARYDRYSFAADDRFLQDGVDDSGARTLDQLSPMLGVTFSSSQNLTVYSNISSSFQTPTTTELSNRPEGVGGFNPALEPERIRNFEIGLKGLWPRKRLQLQAALFQLNLRNMLIPFQVADPGSEEIFFRNAGKARNRGFELSFASRPLPDLQVNLAYTFLDFTFTDYVVEAEVNGVLTAVQLQGNDVAGVPRHHLFVGLSYEHAAGAYAEINAQWFDRSFGNDFNGPAPGAAGVSQSEFVNESYATVDFRIGFQRRFTHFGVDLFLGVNNLLDIRYNGSIVPNAFGNRFFEPAPGLNWYNGLGLTFE